MIVRLDLERRAPAVAHVDDAGVLSRRHDNPFTRRRQSLEMDTRRLVRTVLGPHHREDAELDQIRLASQQFPDAVKFVGGKVVCGDYVRGYHFRVMSNES